MRKGELAVWIGIAATILAFLTYTAATILTACTTDGCPRCKGTGRVQKIGR